MNMPQKLCSVYMSLTSRRLVVNHTWLHLQSPQLLINGSWRHGSQLGHQRAVVCPFPGAPQDTNKGVLCITCTARYMQVSLCPDKRRSYKIQVNRRSYKI